MNTFQCFNNLIFALFCPQVLLMAMKDMNIAKLTSTDLPLFNGITQDLFPAVETPVIDYGLVSELVSG